VRARYPNGARYRTIGVSGLGFEVSPDEGIRLGASVAPLPGSQPPPASQIWTLGPLEPERLLNFEAGLKWRWRRLSGTAAVFDSEIRDLIERRTVILAPGATGQTIGGQTIIRQDASGAVYTSLSSSPVFVRTNAGEVRLTGAEGSIGVRLGPTLALNGNVSWVRGVDLATGLPPGLENGIPPTHGLLALRWEPQGRRYWLEGYSYLSAAQRRFSANDFAQARIGGNRTQQEIANFFNNGAVARGLVSGGVLLATGEKLPQVLTRVLGPDPAAVVPFKTYNPAFATVNIRGGIRFSRHAHLTVLVENLFDANYRTMGSGVDGPGLNVVARQVFTF
jgi:hemoglobin/transferrin/lactoferrin receptor protein